MNARVEQILRKSSYDFAIKCGKTEEEAQAAADQKIASVNKMSEEEETWVDITTGKKHKARY
ncbi:MAG: hypothetical protein WD512_11505 [Candidatus Paceibacterota bacterium]